MDKYDTWTPQPGTHLWFRQSAFDEVFDRPGQPQIAYSSRLLLVMDGLWIEFNLNRLSLELDGCPLPFYNIELK